MGFFGVALGRLGVALSRRGFLETQHVGIGIANVKLLYCGSKPMRMGSGGI